MPAPWSTAAASRPDGSRQNRAGAAGYNAARGEATGHPPRRRRGEISPRSALRREADVAPRSPCRSASALARAGVAGLVEAEQIGGWARLSGAQHAADRLGASYARADDDWRARPAAGTGFIPGSPPRLLAGSPW